MTNTEIVSKTLEGQDHECQWQIVPREIPDDLRSMALELYRTGDGMFHLFQFFIHEDDDGDSPWYQRIEAHMHLISVRENIQFGN